MKLERHNNINDFLIHNEELLIKNESFYNLILGLAYSIRDNQLEVSAPLYYSIRDEHNTIIAAALRSNSDKPFLVTAMPSSALDLIIKNLKDNNITLQAVVGEEVAATYFKDQWIKLNSLTFKIKIHLGVYECFNVILPKIILGELIEAKIEHKDILIDFISGFTRDCFPESPIVKENIEVLMNRHLTNKSLFLLLSHDKKIVSMAANTRSTLAGGTISLVYTPPQLRGQGYASTTVALVADRIMKNGKIFANLFTDLSNPTSNSIYQKIGFTKIGQNIHYDFLESDS